ncbi:MAG: methyltransferase [Candidatus Dadabacteria bacterium]|nr:methyltransferase [Candidatus Dadabacteria bacterium]
MNSEQWKNTAPAPEGTHHLKVLGGEALYPARYDKVLPFRAPGLAAAQLGAGGFHILPDGNPAYSERFTRAFNFYEGLAAVMLQREWFHIHPDGGSAYGGTWNWCGNFQRQRCPVRDARGRYYHIRKNGEPLPGGPHLYAGDFRECVAVVRSPDGLCRHVDSEGRFVNTGAFFDLDVPHKGYACARDAGGWFHIDKDGNDASGGHRYRYLEPFYNGQALARKQDGEMVVIDESGEIRIFIGG